jgi:excisionase family DNA binding protein
MQPDQTTDAYDILATPLLRAEDVAKLLSIKTSTVYELSRRRIDPLPFVRIGRSKRFDKIAIARWVQAHASG